MSGNHQHPQAQGGGPRNTLSDTQTLQIIDGLGADSGRKIEGKGL